MAVVYATYILTSEGIAGRVGPLVLSTLVCTGATSAAELAGSLVTGDLDLRAVTAAGFGLLTAIAVVSTVVAVGLFFAGLERRRAHRRLDPLDVRAACHRRACRSGVRRHAQPTAALRRLPDRRRGRRPQRPPATRPRTEPALARG